MSVLQRKQFIHDYQYWFKQVSDDTKELQRRNTEWVRNIQRSRSYLQRRCALAQAKAEGRSISFSLSISH